VLLVAAAVPSASGCGGGSGGGSSTEAEGSTQSKPKPPPALATRASFTRCLRRAGVRLAPNGAVAGDPGRTKLRRGWSPPYPGATYIGAASYRDGGFSDLWLTSNSARAAVLVAGFHGPGKKPPEERGWTFERSRNILYAVHRTKEALPGDPSATGFRRCLRVG